MPSRLAKPQKEKACVLILFTQASAERIADSIHISNWWRLAGLNRRLPACKAGALPTELSPHVRVNLTNVNRAAVFLRLPTSSLSLYRQTKRQLNRFSLVRRFCLQRCKQGMELDQRQNQLRNPSLLFQRRCA